MWQISSGYKPFLNAVHDVRLLTIAIIKGRREKIINGTYVCYSNLYKSKYEVFITLIEYFFILIFFKKNRMLEI